MSRRELVRLAHRRLKYHVYQREVRLWFYARPWMWGIKYHSSTGLSMTWREDQR